MELPNSLLGRVTPINFGEAIHLCALVKLHEPIWIILACVPLRLLEWIMLRNDSQGSIYE